MLSENQEVAGGKMSRRDFFKKAAIKTVIGSLGIAAISFSLGQKDAIAACSCCTGCTSGCRGCVNVR